MNREIQAPAYGIIAPMMEPSLTPEITHFELAFTKKQRDWWLRVYSNSRGIPQCGFVEYDERHGFHRCHSTEPLQVHHIIPDAWTRAQTPEKDPNDINTTYGIALCKYHHIEIIHPDIGQAMRDYWKDPDAISKAVAEHKTLAQQGIIFWDDTYDQLMTRTAIKRVSDYLRMRPYDTYPVDKKWAKTEHPKPSDWKDLIL